VEYLGVDPDGVAHLRLNGSCDGCASSSATVQLAIRGAVESAAPEVVLVDVVNVTAERDPRELPVLQIGRRPDGDAPGAPLPPGGWTAVAGAPPPRDGLRGVDVGGVRAVLCDVGGALYAYADRCPACAYALADGALRGGVLACARCGGRYDVRRAGNAVGGSGAHLEPIPLLADRGVVRLAVPAGSGV
jgi:nitrite reductase/ring-hydroxylating ferredoxin subunit